MAVLGVGEEEHTIPWSKLDYDTSLGGYRTDITEDQLRGAPTFYRECLIRRARRAARLEVHRFRATLQRIRNAKLHLVSDRGHLLIWEEPDLAAQLVRDFLRGSPAT